MPSQQFDYEKIYNLAESELRQEIVNRKDQKQQANRAMMLTATGLLLGSMMGALGTAETLARTRQLNMSEVKVIEQLIDYVSLSTDQDPLVLEHYLLTHLERRGMAQLEVRDYQKAVEFLLAQIS